MKFSQRIGVRPRLELQLNEMSDVLRNRLWNAISPHLKVNPYLLYLKETEYRDLKLILTRLWTDHFGLPLDEMSDRAPNRVHAVRTRYFESEWWEVYDLVEFFVQVLVPRYSDPFIQEVNAALEKECSGYRLVFGQFVPITSPEQLEAVANAVRFRPKPFPHVAEHLRVAAVLIGKRPEPDYRNSIKEVDQRRRSFDCGSRGRAESDIRESTKEFWFRYPPVVASGL